MECPFCHIGIVEEDDKTTLLKIIKMENIFNKIW